MTDEKRSEEVEGVIGLAKWFVHRLSSGKVYMLGGFEDATQALLSEAFQAVEDAKRTGGKVSTFCVNRWWYRMEDMCSKGLLIRVPRKTESKEKYAERIEKLKTVYRIGHNANEGGGLSFEDEVLDIEEGLIVHHDHFDAVADLREGLLKAAMKIKRPRHRKFLILHYGLNGGEPMSCDDIGRAHRMTRQKASRIVREAVNELRERSDEIRQKVTG